MLTMKRDDLVTTLPILHERKGDCVAPRSIENDLAKSNVCTVLYGVCHSSLPNGVME